MRRAGAAVKSGDDAQLWTFTLLFVDDLLRIIEAAAAFRLETVKVVSCLGRARAFARGLADFLFGDGIANADNHKPHIMLMRPIRNDS